MQISNLNMRKGIYFFIALLIAFLVGTKTPSVSAQIPQPTPIPCNEVGANDIEFHSLRPYQASPCNTTERELALYCANDILLTDRFGASEGGAIFPASAAGASFAPTCIDEPTRGVRLCTYSVPRTKNIAVDLTRAELPIAGNTEDVRNYTNAKDATGPNPAPETINHNQKINEYISWYLHGVINRAEYPFEGISVECDGSDPECDKNNNNRADTLERIVDQSGPLRKLLPQRIQNRERVKQIEDAVRSVANTADIRHNQIAGCTGQPSVPIPFPIIGNLSVVVPIPCNRLTFPVNLLIDEDKIRLTNWFIQGGLPPQEEDYQTRPFIDYWKDYQEWRGRICAQTPAFGALPSILLCVNPPIAGVGTPDYLAELFPYIPFSTTEDNIGNFRLEQNPPPLAQGSEPAGRNNIRISRETISGEPASDLFFAHMQEDDQLADLLQQTYVPQELDRNAPVDPNSTTLVGGEFCNIVQVKTNPGDDLFGENFQTQLSYTAGFSCEYVLPSQSAGSGCIDSYPPICNTVSCDPAVRSDCTCPDPANPTSCTRRDCNDQSPRCYPSGYSCGQDNGQQDCASGYVCSLDCSPPDVNACELTTFHTIPAYTDTPYADSVWARLVAGPVSAFKRIFPQIGTDGPLSEIVDLPASSGLSYSTPDAQTQVTAGGVRAGASAELYFPHLGGLHEYFLQCTQRLLRPKDFGPECGDVQAPGAIIGGTGSGALLTNIALSGARDGKFPHIVAWGTDVHVSFNPQFNVMYWYKVDSSEAFGTGIDIGDAPGQADFNAGSLGVAQDGSVYYVWTVNQGSNGAVFVRRRSPDGTWGPQVTIAQAGGRKVFSRVGIVGNRIIVAWSENARFRYSTSTAPGTAWSQPALLENVESFGAPYIGSNSINKLILAYGTQGNIKVGLWNGAGFSASTVISAGGSFYADPTATVTPDGTEHVAFRRVGGGIYTASRVGNGGWTVTQLHNSDARGTVGISSDGQGGIHLAWSALAPTPTGLYYMYKAPGGNWTAPTHVPSSAQWEHAKVAATSENGIYGHVVVEDWSSGPPSARYFKFTIREGSGTPGGFPTPPLGSACTNLPNMAQYGLPNITDSGTGQNGYFTLLNRIKSNPDSDWAMKAMIQGEKDARAKGFNVIQYLTTAWVWFESASGYPNPYAVNCDDRGTTASSVDRSCRPTQGQCLGGRPECFQWQFAGYQVQENRKDYRDVFSRIHGSSDSAVRSVMNDVVTNSIHGGKAHWKYTGTQGLLQYLPTRTSATLNTLVTSGSEMYTTTDQRQFLTGIVGKDPAMIAALNSEGYGGVSNADLVARLRNPSCTADICRNKELLANMVIAAYLYDNGCTTVGSTPTP